jgi:hypothetical protein
MKRQLIFGFRSGLVDSGVIDIEAVGALSFAIWRQRKMQTQVT